MVNTNLMLKKGFTLIELLIVIAVLGILAIAVISAINPIEQINRSKDTGSTSDTEQLISAIDRYYASQTLYPWQAVTTDPIALAWTKVGSTTPVNMLARLSEGTTGTIVGTGELKASYINRISQASYNYLHIYKGANDSDSVYICYKPLSKSFQTTAATRCAAGGHPADYPGGACGNTTDCGSEKNCICLP